MSKEEQYREMFYSEAFENHEELNRLFTILEKNHEDLESIDSIFRITHTLKGNAMGLGCSEIADLTHVMEDIFGEIRQGKLQIDESLFNNLYRANDKLGELIAALKEPTRVNYKGIRTKLRVFLNKSTKTEIEKVPLEMKTSDVVVSELDTEELETVSAQKLN
ncbi:MAG: Hpt domain-containing protein, partial [Flavobacteriales bacterium]|nr:Hpt domain-containing protein [Flavobacteriales bacterium]